MANHLKNIRKGSKVIMFTFSGMRIGEFKVLTSNKTTIQVMRKDGSLMLFERKTGKQIGAKRKGFANVITTEADLKRGATYGRKLFESK